MKTKLLSKPALLLSMFLLPGLAVAQSDLDKPISEKCLQHKKPTEKYADLMIYAPSGTLLKAPADGAVAFADWLNGDGLLLIVDYGRGCAVGYHWLKHIYKQPGAFVKAGETLAEWGEKP